MPETGGTFWGYETEFRNNDIQMLPYDPDLAKQYLAASVYKGEEVELASGVPVFHRGAEMIAEQLGRIGINVRLFQTDAPTLQSYANPLNNQAQMIHHTNNFNKSAVSARGSYYSTGASNRSSFNNPLVDELVDKAPTITDPKEREAVYRQIQEILYEDLPYISIYNLINCTITSSAVGGIILDSDNNHDYRGIFMVLED